MRTIEYKGVLEVYESIEELGNDQERLLCQKAYEARSQAYADYSGFNVGTALLLESGDIVLGSNQENAVYPLSLCAERVAMFSSQNLYPSKKMIALALVTSAKDEADLEPIFPCGSCRQAIVEQEYRQGVPIKILVIDSKGKVFV